MARIINTAVAEVATQVIGLDDNADHEINAEFDGCENDMDGIVYITLASRLILEVNFTGTCTSEYLSEEWDWFDGRHCQVWNASIDKRNWTFDTVEVTDCYTEDGEAKPTPTLTCIDMTEIKKYIDDVIVKQEELV